MPGWKMPWNIETLNSGVKSQIQHAQYSSDSIIYLKHRGKYSHGISYGINSLQFHIELVQIPVISPNKM